MPPKKPQKKPGKGKAMKAAPAKAMGKAKAMKKNVKAMTAMKAKAMKAISPADNLLWNAIKKFIQHMPENIKGPLQSKWKSIHLLPTSHSCAGISSWSNDRSTDSSVDRWVDRSVDRSANC